MKGIPLLTAGAVKRLSISKGVSHRSSSKITASQNQGRRQLGSIVILLLGTRLRSGVADVIAARLFVSKETSPKGIGCDSKDGA